MINQYKTIWYYSEEDEAYIIFAPDLPRCFANGETLEEAKQNIVEIIDEWIEYAKKLGRTIPKPLTNLDSSKSSVFDVAKYILTQTGEISTLMLQNLVYYCEAWALTWFYTSLFPQRFEAWKRGPVCRKLFERHKGKFVISAKDIQGDHTLSDSEKHLINNVLAVYGQEDPEWLSALTHTELPWKKTRGNLSDESLSHRVIQPSLIENYYSIGLKN